MNAPPETPTPRCSPLLAMFDADAFEIGPVFGMQTAIRAQHLGTATNYLADLSALRRRLFVGHGVPAWLAEYGLDVSLDLLGVAELNDGAVLARVHREQYVLIDGIERSPCEALFAVPPGRHGDVLVLPCEAIEIACGGADVDTLLSELCPYDVKALAPDVWGATRFAHCEVALRLVAAPKHYRVFCSPADARFLYHHLAQMTLAGNGTILGFDDFRALLQHRS